MTRESIISSVSQIFELLVNRRYSELERLTNGRRLTAAEIAEAVNQFPYQIAMPSRQDLEKLVDIEEVKNAASAQFSVWVDLWTNEEGRSDLSIRLTMFHLADCSVNVEIDGILVS